MYIFVHFYFVLFIHSYFIINRSATLYKWVGQYGKIQTPDGEVTNNKEIKKLKKELNDLKIENEILKKAMAIFTQK